MLGKFSAVAGPFLVGYVSVTTGNPRASIAVLLAFFVIGAALLTFVNNNRKAN
jgi:UMF1 family MFS transporter